MSHIAVRLCTVAAVLFLAAESALAQQPLGVPVDEHAAEHAAAHSVEHAAACPSVDESDGVPLELRIAGLLMRVQVRDLARPEGRPEGELGEEENGAGVQVRLVSCDAASSHGVDDARGPDDADAADARDADAESPLLRLIHDLRVGLELEATEEGRCLRARFAIADQAGPAAAGVAGAASDPVDLELCGLPFTLPDGQGRQGRR